MLRGVAGSLQRIEAGRLPALQCAILPAERPHQNLKSPVLVEDDLSGSLAGQHRDQEADEDGLAGAGRPADERVARILARPAFRVLGIARMEREVKRRARARDEYGERLAPVVARRTSRRVVMKGDHRGEVARGDRRLAGSHGEVPGQLGPEGRLERQILPRHRHPGVGQERPRERHVIIQRSSCDARSSPRSRGARMPRSWSSADRRP